MMLLGGIVISKGAFGLFKFAGWPSAYGLQKEQYCGSASVSPSVLGNR